MASVFEEKANNIPIDKVTVYLIDSPRETIITDCPPVVHYNLSLGEFQKIDDRFLAISDCVWNNWEQWSQWDNWHNWVQWTQWAQWNNWGQWGQWLQWSQWDVWGNWHQWINASLPQSTDKPYQS